MTAPRPKNIRAELEFDVSKEEGRYRQGRTLSKASVRFLGENSSWLQLQRASNTSICRHLAGPEMIH